MFYRGIQELCDGGECDRSWWARGEGRVGLRWGGRDPGEGPWPDRQHVETEAHPTTHPPALVDLSICSINITLTTPCLRFLTLKEALCCVHNFIRRCDVINVVCVCGVIDFSVISGFPRWIVLQWKCLMSLDGALLIAGAAHWGCRGHKDGIAEGSSNGADRCLSSDQLSVISSLSDLWGRGPQEVKRSRGMLTFSLHLPQSEEASFSLFCLSLSSPFVVFSCSSLSLITCPSLSPPSPLLALCACHRWDLRWM